MPSIRGAGEPVRSEPVPELHTFAIFAAASAAFLAVPGPSVIYIVVAQRRPRVARAGFVSALGIQAGGLVHVAAATVGLSALLAVVGDGVQRREVRSARRTSSASGVRRLLDARRASPRTRRRPRGRQAAVLAGRRRQRAQPEDGAVLPRLPAAVRRSRPRRRSRPQVLALGRRCSWCSRTLSDSTYALVAGSVRGRGSASAAGAMAQVSGVSYIGLGLLAAFSPVERSR